ARAPAFGARVERARVDPRALRRSESPEAPRVTRSAPDARGAARGRDTLQASCTPHVERASASRDGAQAIATGLSAAPSSRLLSPLSFSFAGAARRPPPGLFMNRL